MNKSGKELTIKKLRVLHVVYSFGTGGMEKGVATVISNASEHVEHVLLCLSTSGETERLLPPDTKVLELNKPPGNSPTFLWRLARTMKALNPTVVHTRNWGGTDGIIAARLAGIRAVVHGEHGWEIKDTQGKNSKRLTIRRILSRWVREYTCVSQHQIQWFQDVIRVKKPLSQIYNGVDTHTFSPATDDGRSRRALGIPEQAFVVGIVGRLAPIKDHPTLFHAAVALKASWPDLRVVVVGDGPERQRLERLAGENIIFLGNRLDIPDVFRSFDAFVLPSLNEGISNTILEAMATGLPVIATRVGGNSELVDDGRTGVLVPPQEPNAIASALFTYLKNPDVRRLHGTRGRERAIQLFSVKNMVKGYETVYQRVASGIT